MQIHSAAKQAPPKLRRESRYFLQCTYRFYVMKIHVEHSTLQNGLMGAETAKGAMESSRFVRDVNPVAVPPVFI